MKNLKIIHEFSKEVKLIEDNEQKYIYKKIVLPVTYEQEVLKKKFVDFLSKNQLNVAKILEIIEDENGELYELQEFVECDKETSKNLGDILKEIATFHKIAAKWSLEELNDKVYDSEDFCCGIMLKKILLGFEEKYYSYPLQNYEENKNLIPLEVREKVEQIVNNFKIIYKYFVERNDIHSCICHNDLTTNNYLIKDDKIYFIDFDFAIHTSEYVDVIDVILKRSLDLEDAINNYEEFKKNISSLLNSYNEVNDKLTLESMLAMLVIKIVSYNIYINLNEVNLSKLLNDINQIEQITNLIKEDLKN